MKKRIEELISDYERRLKELDKMLSEATDHQTKLRLEIKKGNYHSFIVDLRRLLKNED
jgi:predicted component of type VI protein secretion system